MIYNSLQGLIVINKPSGITSHTVVQRVKKILRVRKAGHTGTLDPFATGVLPICINEATKLSPFLLEEEKGYEGLFRLGIETDTQDITGRIISTKDSIDIKVSDIEKAFQKFRGSINQVPPMYSALKHKGTPLYLLARQGKEVERKPREVEIKELSVLNIELPWISFSVACSKGTYIRTLVNDIGKNLGCGACLEKLKRTRSGKFLLENSVNLETLKSTSLEKIEANWILSPTQALSSFPAVTVDEEISQNIRQGKVITLGELRGKASPPIPLKGISKVLNAQNKLVAIVETSDPVCFGNNRNWEDPAWRLIRVFNFD